MSKRFTIFVSIIVVGLILTACASNAATKQPTAAAPTTPAENNATPSGYPAAPTKVAGQAAPTGYPAPSQAVPPVGNSNTGYPAPGTFKLILADGSEKAMAVDTLNTLPKEKITFDGTELNVLSLVNALKQYGVESYNQIIVSGANGAGTTLTKDLVAKAYLDILADGTARLVIQGQPQSSWVAGLVSLTIQ